MRHVCCVAILIGASALIAFGQEATGSLAGKVIDSTGASISKARIRLTQEGSAHDQIGGATDDQGEFLFVGLPAGAYTVETFMPGFVRLTVKGVKIMEGASVTLPPFALRVGQLGCGGPWPVNYFRILDNSEKLGSISGRIQVDEGPLKGITQSIRGATVTLLCTRGGSCGQTITNQEGEFSFSNIFPGNASLQIAAKGYYPREESGFSVEAGWERNYGRFSLRKCSDKKCDPAKLPKKVIACE